MTKKAFVIFHKRKESQFMPVVAESNSSLYKKISGFNKLVLN